MATPSETDTSIVDGNPTASNTSEKGSDFMKNLQRLGNFTLGNDNSSEKLTEKPTGNLKDFSFGPLNTSTKLAVKISKLVSRKLSGNLEGLTFGLLNTYGDLPGKPCVNLGNFNSVANEDWISDEFSDMPSGNFDPFDLLNTSNEEVQAPTSGTPVQFKPTFGVETARVVKTVTTIHQCINMMKEYSGKSLEELRLEDYKDNRKGKESLNSTLQSGGFFVPNLMTISQGGGISVPNSTTTSQTGGFYDLNFKTSSQSGGFSVPKSPIKSHADGSFFSLANTDTRPSDLKFDATGTSGISKLSEGLQELLLTGKHSDVTLNVQSKEFNVHKNILSIWSPVLSEMIENETKENASMVVKIDDFDPDIFSDFLHFLYTGSTRKLNEKNILKLYIIADEYKVHELSKICVNYTKDNITLQNFCDILTFSLKYDERELMKVAMQFFMEHSTEITVTDNWELFLKNSPDKANELLLKATK